jgi:hypothetical protein
MNNYHHTPVSNSDASGAQSKGAMPASSKAILPASAGTYLINNLSPTHVLRPWLHPPTMLTTISTSTQGP